MTKTTTRTTVANHVYLHIKVYNNKNDMKKINNNEAFLKPFRIA